MPTLIPPTGSEIAMGKVHSAYTNASYPSAENSNISLSSLLGGFVGISTGTQISLSSTFGGRSTPYDYPE